MRRVVLGTAGHIDHGKTALVRALTGMDTDRLAEEKRRGITIELGFAHLDLGGGMVAGVVDVPGHEKFIKAMVAGAGGVDVVLLCIAADEGVMPQTREHLDVCQLLGAQRGVVALTKSDLLPGLGPQWLELCEADVREAMRGTFLASAPIVACSSRTGEGLDRLREALAAAATGAPERPADGPTFLPIDRAFTLKGFGTVVTGTLLHGRIAPGDAVDVVPGPGKLRGLRVRGVQVHGEDVACAEAGRRTAVNLPGAQAQDVPRGGALVPAGALEPTSMLDAEIELLSGARPLRQQAKLLCHLGTALAPATIALLDRGTLAPGERGLAQIRLAAPLAALPGMRFILRGFAPVPGRGATVGGGRVLAIHPRRRRPGRAEAVQSLDALRSGDDTARVEWLVRDAGLAGVEAGALWTRAALPRRALEAALDRLSSAGTVVLFDRERRAYVHARAQPWASGRERR